MTVPDFSCAPSVTGAATHPIWNRLIRFQDDSGRERFGEPVDEDLDVGIAISEGKDVYARILGVDSALDLGGAFTGEVGRVRTLLSPLRPSEVGTVRCVGLNYRKHAAELNMPIPKSPTVFLKPQSCIISSTAPIYFPHASYEHDCHLDYEVELAIVIKTTCKDVLEADAMDHVLGYMTSNDVTARKHQMEVSQWDRGKGFDGFAPIGPTVVSARLIPDPSVLRLKTMLNRQVMQEAETSDMIFSVPRIVSFLSQGTTLPAGTVILTGTPSGVGDGRDPPVHLATDDVLRVSISHGLGTLTNNFVSKESPVQKTKLLHY